MASSPLNADDDEGAEAEGSANDLKLDAIHQEALLRFDECWEATRDQRDLSLVARRFGTIPGAQWEGAGWQDIGANTIRIEVNKTARGLEKITNDYRANRVTNQFRAVGDQASEHTAAMLGGVFRADAYHFKAQQAYDNAFEEAAAGGFGAWRLTTAYSDPADYDDDSQRINPGMTIVDADQRVFFDLNSKLYDKSDAQFAFVVTATTRRAFEAEHPDGTSSWPEGALRSQYDWYGPDVCLVAEYYVVEMNVTTRLTFVHGLSDEVQRYWASDLPTADRAEMVAQGWRLKSSRRVERRQIHKYTLSGSEVLCDDGMIAGDCIPIVPVYGKRWFIENREWWRGHVQLAMDSQRLYNLQLSKMAETAALAPREVPIFHPEQMLGHDADWARANVDRLPYLLVNPMLGPDGAPIPGAQVGKIEPPQLSPVQAALIQITAGDMAELTAANDGADEARSNVSAQAMEIAATRVDAKSATYMDNMRQSMQRAGEIYMGIAPDIYFEPGRVLEKMGDDGMLGNETLHEQATDPTTGVSQIRNDLSRGRYSVIADVTEATSTRRDKTVRSMLNIASVATAGQQPELAGAALFTAVQNMDGEGIDDLQKWARSKGLAIGLFTPTDAEKATMAETQQNQAPDPTAAVAQAQALALAATAKKEDALADKLVADTGLSKAKALQILSELQGVQTSAADDHEVAQADLAHKHAQTQAVQVGSLTALHGAHTTRLKVNHDVMNAQSAGGDFAKSETLQ